MSFDCCSKCGILAKEPYKAITIECAREDCPQRLRNRQWKEFLSQFPKRTLKETWEEK